MSNNSILSVEKLGITFGGIHALEDISFDVKEKSITAIIGPNGAGKTTLFNCLTGFYNASKGALYFNEKHRRINIRALLGMPFQLGYLLSPYELYQCLYYKMFGGSHLVAQLGIARTFQNIRLFKEMTVVENLLVAQHIFAHRNLLSGLFNTKKFQHWENQALEIAFYWLANFHLTAQANRLAGELSYGQQRHLEIARCLCLKPKLLCLDEPAAGLNPQETEELSILLQHLKQSLELSILLIEHDMNMVMGISDQIVVLDHGKVICQGSPEMVRDNKRVIAAYLGIEQDAA
ncbi:ATP-binding cassette domain-containing protein [Candidatus Berkiella cookevillensis]|uniref:ATP-binding cassette domain-containing protein n=1 Tax=Candidatus Berkiella cookevillensis TaxID=437022 RepID=A0A0Q9YSM2_9GAMM|nr:ATP-binding cassette domain-containing protein [Candidatus Berkiella cookevillensis]MCS5707636.1 ATP-binding cassette domain-containing protein [Candidatus Berkiella cookevillensis]